MASESKYSGRTGLYWEHGETKEASGLSYDSEIIDFVWEYASKATNI
jgi:hypothetical protein